MKSLCNFFVVLILLTGCLTPYPAPNIGGAVGLLVVDGFVDVGQHSATVKLSRSTPLSSKEASIVETGAYVKIETDSIDIELTEISPGIYFTANGSFEADKSFKLFITTSDNVNYSSSAVTGLSSPKIDSITWTPDPTGITIYGNTSDSLTSSRFYIWTFEETWEYTSYLESDLIILNGQVLPRTPNQQVHYCWKTQESTKVLVSTSSKLNKNVISGFELKKIPKGSQQISNRYSMLAKLRSLSEEEYNYWHQVENSNQNLGTIFDPLPSQVIGNVINLTNPKQPVIGYFSAGEINQERIFIGLNQLPIYLFSAPSNDCNVNDELLIPYPEVLNYTAGLVIVGQTPPGGTVGYYLISQSCGDCTYYGGVTTPPSFWH